MSRGWAEGARGQGGGNGALQEVAEVEHRLLLRGVGASGEKRRTTCLELTDLRTFGKRLIEGLALASVPRPQLRYHSLL